MIKRGMESRKKTESAVISASKRHHQKARILRKRKELKLTRQENHAIICKTCDRWFLLQRRRDRSIHQCNSDRYHEAAVGHHFPAGDERNQPHALSGICTASLVKPGKGESLNTDILLAENVIINAEIKKQFLMINKAFVGHTENGKLNQ